MLPGHSLIEFLCSFSLKPRANMAVQVQGDRHTRMSQTFADYLRVYPLLHHQSGMSVPEIMKPNVRNTGFLHYVSESMGDGVRPQWRAVDAAEY